MDKVEKSKRCHVIWVYIHEHGTIQVKVEAELADKVEVLDGNLVILSAGYVLAVPQGHWMLYSDGRREIEAPVFQGDQKVV